MIMENLDYEELGLKIGFEIHQELDTHKLFCDCSSVLKDDEPSRTIKRELRPTESELGEIDRAALAEAAKSKKFRYEIMEGSTCLVEMDEEPPHPVNEKARNIALEAALLFKANPVDEAHVMRKTVIDGSNTAGFQRTILIATDGKMEIDGKEIDLPTFCLEEDAARKREESSNYIKYRLDRLGIPLLEIATGPDFTNPKSARKAAEKMGRILRATGKMKRGIGTIRQDVNVSIEDGSRQEIKGVQELSLITTVVEREVLRQIRLLEIMRELKERGTQKINEEIKEVTEVFSNTDSDIIEKAVSDGGVYAVKLEKFDGLLGKELEPDRRFGTELADYAKTYGEVEGIFHTDELPAFGITVEEVEELKDRLNAEADDAVVIIADEENKARKGLEAVIDRANKAFEGVPEETRRALPDGNTQYMRPLPGAARMYVETDVPPTQISQKELEEINSKLPEKPDEKKERYREELNLSEDLANQMSTSDRAELFEDIVEDYGADPTLVASVLEQTLTKLEGEGFAIENVTEESLKKTFELVSDGEISKDAIPPMLGEISEGANVEEAVEELGIKKMDREKIEEIIEDVVRKKEELIQEKGERAVDALMGVAMGQVEGKADGETVHEILEEKIGERLS